MILAVLAMALLLRFEAFWGFLLVLAELFASPLGRVWTELHRRVDGVRAFLGPVKRLPTALIGLPLLFVGLALGSWAPDSVFWLGDGVATAINGIARAAPYVIFFTLTPAIAGILAVGRAGRFALQVNASYVVLTALAGLLALIVLTPFFGLRLTGLEASGTARVEVDLAQMLFSTPAFQAIFAAAGLALMIHGFALKGLHEATRFVGGKLVDFLGDLLKILLPLILLALGVFIPTRIAAAIDQARLAGAQTGAGWVGQLSPSAAYFAGIGALVLILAIWMVGFASAVMRYTGFSLKRFFRDYFFDVFAYAWATASSNATIPLNLERTGSALKVRSSIREFIIPLGATVHLDGTMIGAMVGTVVAAQLVGYTPSVLDLLYLVVPLVILTVGAPGIPGGLALVAGPVIANLLPLSPEAAPVFTAIFIGFTVGLSDQFRSGVNATSNGVLCRLFEYWFPKPLKDRGGVPAPVTAPAPRPRRPATGIKAVPA